MRIALDARWLNRSLHGIARYSLNLLRALPLSSQDSLLVLYNRQDFEPSELQELPLARQRQLIWLDCQQPIFARAEALKMTALLAELRPDLLHIPAYWKPYASPCPWVMTLHDLIHLEQPSLKYRLYYAWLRQHLRRSAGILTVSGASARQIRQWCGLNARVTYPGVDQAYTPGPVLLPELRLQGVEPPYFVYVGNPKPHKRADFVLRASAALKARHQLVTLGIPASGQARHLALKDFPEHLMPSLYRGAQALLLPSSQEGFGLPGAEALACACPVLASEIAVFAEVLPGARLLPLDDLSSWIQAMQDCLLDPLQRPEAFHYSWQDMANQTYEVYQQCLN